MKNVTLSVDEAVLRTVRLYAAERGSTVNALVREFLNGLAGKEDRARRARRRIAEVGFGLSAQVLQEFYVTVVHKVQVRTTGFERGRSGGMTKTLALLGLTAGVVLHGSAAEVGAQDCAAADVEFICDQVGPEDLFAVPGTPWVLASSYPEGSGGLRVIDTRDLTTTALLPAASPRERFDRATYGSCPGPVAVDNTHGLYVAPGTGPVRTVYATHHGARESVEVFELDVGTEPPELTWIGCAVAPEPLNLNSVVALPDGGFAATSFRDLGAPIEPIMTGAFSGAIWEWRPGAGWEMVPGSETSGPNGIEISPDGRWFYVGGWGTQSFVRLSRGRTPIQRAEVAAEFRIDNLRMQPDGSILATGQGSRDAPMTTSNVARVDPETLTLEEIIRRPNDETFAMGTTAIEVGDEIWVGSLQGDRIARFPAE